MNDTWMKIISYNLKYGGKGRVYWKEIIDRFSPDVLLVQESYPRSDIYPICLCSFPSFRNELSQPEPMAGKVSMYRWLHLR